MSAVLRHCALRRLLHLVILVCFAGCAGKSHRVDEVLRNDPGIRERVPGVTDHYTVHYPDVIAVRISGETEYAERAALTLDGRVELPGIDPVRLDGLTCDGIRKVLAQSTRVHENSIQVSVVDYQSQRVYLSGPGHGVQRTVPYIGPETVLDLLRRSGGVKPGAAPTNVYVIRSGIVENVQPKVFHIDLKEEAAGRDHPAGLRLLPFDQVYVGETRSSSLESCFPRWLRPLYDKLCGLPCSTGSCNPPLPPNKPE